MIITLHLQNKSNTLSNQNFATFLLLLSYSMLQNYVFSDWILVKTSAPYTSMTHRSAYWAFLSSLFLCDAASCLIHFSFCVAEPLQQQQQQMQAQTDMRRTPPTTPIPMISANMLTSNTNSDQWRNYMP